MFDIGFSELLLFGVIALIVLGPEKLPKAARTAGQWYAKIRRTVSTLQSEIEAEFDLAETRQQMQDEIAKIRQTETDMKRELAEMRGSMKEFESSQNQSLNAAPETELQYKQDLEPMVHPRPDSLGPKKSMPKEFNYAYGQEQTHQPFQSAEDTSKLSNIDDNNNIADGKSANVAVQPIITKPWENMWFRLGPYDKARRLPAPPLLPNYKADSLLNSALNQTSLNAAPASTPIISPPSLVKQEADK
ncbi:twin-arginine translocase subunit TatB [Psychrobacter frigidicola]|uniref:Sec-independent protein translocase protein TatB n=1 Tax=Psychrobacter frigidicola TaxID=45611 RepID=A0A5C7A5U5_9GAMM|nr:Sec-independent protein translocase protein TatB [Psychrobacter frigidicola]TXD96159.1 twin-arginine translocase subunit TatB [Psychrobacter frigidicola]